MYGKRYWDFGEISREGIGDYPEKWAELVSLSMRSLPGYSEEELSEFMDKLREDGWPRDMIVTWGNQSYYCNMVSWSIYFKCFDWNER